MSTSPVRRLRLSQRLMVERETPKSSATSFLGMPRSIAASVFNLRSFEYACMDPIFVQVHYLRNPLLELREGEVRRIPLPRTRVNRARRRVSVLLVRSPARLAKLIFVAVIVVIFMIPLAHAMPVVPRIEGADTIGGVFAAILRACLRDHDVERD